MIGTEQHVRGSECATHPHRHTQREIERIPKVHIKTVKY